VDKLYRISYYEAKNNQDGYCLNCPNWRNDSGCLRPHPCDFVEWHDKDIYAASEDAAYEKLDELLDERSAIVSSHIEEISPATQMIEQRITPLFNLEAFEVSK